MRRNLVLTAMAALVGVALLGGWLWLRASPEQAAGLLQRWGIEAQRARDLVTRLGGAPDHGPRPLALSGSIEADEVSVVSEFAGRIARLYAREGDYVASDQVLVELDTSLLEAEMVQARAALSAAQASLAQTLAGAHPADILTAEASLDQAIADRDAAWTTWKDAQAILGNPQELDAQIIQTQAEVDGAAAVIEEAQSRLALAQAQRDQHNPYGSMQEKGLYRVYDYQVQAAQAALEAARAEKEADLDTLATLKAVRDSPLTILSQVHVAEGQYNVAAAGVAVAEARLAELRAGPTAEEISVAQAHVDRAQAAVDALQVQLDRMVLRSPISGQVTSRPASAGETALAGITLLTVADLGDVRLVVYVPVASLGLVFLGQEVLVEADAFPGEEFAGVVAFIAQQAEFTPKNVKTAEGQAGLVLAVEIRIDNPDHRLRPGMPAEAVLDAE